MNKNPNSPSEEKTRIEKIAGGTKTTVTGADGKKTITYDGVRNLHIHLKKQTSHTSDPSSKTVKTGVTFKQVGSLSLYSKQVKEISHQTSHTMFASSKDYKASTSSSSKSDQGAEQPAHSMKIG